MTLNLTHFTNHTNLLTITISEINYLQTPELIHILLDFLNYKPMGNYVTSQISEYISTFCDFPPFISYKMTITSNHTGELLIEVKNGEITFENPFYFPPTPPTQPSGGRVSIGKKQHTSHSTPTKRSTYTAYMVNPEREDFWNCHGVSCNSLARLAQYAYKCSRWNKCEVYVVSDATGEILVTAKPDDISCECYFDTLDHVSSFNPSKVPYYHKLVKENVWFTTIEKAVAFGASRAKRFKLSMPLIYPEYKCDNPVVTRGHHFGHHYYETINHWAWNNCLTRRVKGTFYCEDDHDAFILAEHGWKIRREEKVTTLTNPGNGASWQRHLWIVENL